MDEEARADQAKAILENKMFQKAMKEVKEEIYLAWSQVPARDTEGREWLYKMFKAQERFEAVFKGYIDSGKLASVKQPKFRVFN